MGRGDGVSQQTSGPALRRDSVATQQPQGGYWSQGRFHKGDGSDDENTDYWWKGKSYTEEEWEQLSLKENAKGPIKRFLNYRLNNS